MTSSRVPAWPVCYVTSFLYIYIYQLHANFRSSFNDLRNVVNRQRERLERDSPASSLLSALRVRRAAPIA